MIERSTKYVKATLAVGIAAALLLGATAAFFRRSPERSIDAAKLQFAAVRVESEESNRSSTVQTLLFDDGDDVLPARAFLRRPHDLAPQPRILLTYVGQATERKILRLIPPRPDLVLVAMQYPYQSPENRQEVLTTPLRIRRAAIRSVAAGMMAIDYLESEGYELDRLAVLGVSLGAPFAVLHGALDPRVPKTLVVHGGGDLPAVIRHLYQRRHRPKKGWLYSNLARVFLHSFEPSRWIPRISPREVIILGSKDDEVFPKRTVQLLYNRAGHPKKISWSETDHVRSKRPDIVEGLVLEIESALRELPGEESKLPDLREPERKVTTASFEQSCAPTGATSHRRARTFASRDRSCPQDPSVATTQRPIGPPARAQGSTTPVPSREGIVAR